MEDAAFQWPGAIPLSQWVRETAGFELSGHHEQFWIIAKAKRLPFDRVCRESLRSLLLTVVQQWTRHDRNNESSSSLETTNRTNLLCQGFAWQPPHTKAIQKHLNAAVDFWISSPDTIALHRAIGDDLLRYLWRFPVLHCIPSGNTNAWQICGAPLHWKARKHPRTAKRPRKRRRIEYRSVIVPKPLQPQFCLFRRNLLYKNIFTKHVGHGTRLDSIQTPDELMRAMLSECTSANDQTVESLFMEERWKPVCETILENHDRLDYHRILERFCPLPDKYKELPLSDLVKSYCSSVTITKFCEAVFNKLLPAEFWGHVKNQEYFLNHTLPTICTLRRHDRFPNHRLVFGLRLKHMKWLQTDDTNSRHDTALLEQRVLSTLRWWIQRYLWELLPRVCYATDTEFLGKQEIVYYRNPVWALIRNHALKSLHQYQRLSNPPESLPVSQLRLLPKATGVRPIATLHCSDVSDQKSANSLLTDAFTVLSHCINPEDSFGAGMQGMHELHARYREFLLKNSTKQLYFASVDIRHCYDNIQVEHLLQLLEEKIVTQPEYLIQKYFVMFPNRTIKKRTIVGRPGDYTPFAQGLQGWQKEFDNGVFIDGVQQIVVSSKDVVDSIRKHFETNTVVVKGKYGDRFFRQIKGIPQGSIISTISCNVYYGDMEKRLRVESKDFSESLLSRMMDDFLLITTDSSEREKFYSQMSKGIPSRGVEIHPDKTQLSQDDDETFPWCGFLFNIKTGEVRLDYSRFHDGVVSGGLTADFRNPGAHFISQMQTFCRPRCIPLLFDSAINTISNRIYNFYQLVAFAFVKIVLYDLPFSNERFFSVAIEQTFQFSYRLIEARLRPYSHEAFLDYSNAQWLGCKAWNDVARLSQHAFSLDLPTIHRKRRLMLERIAGQALVDLSLDRLMR